MNVIAVDVGTTSVRLAIISFKGKHFDKAKILASHEKEISHRQNGNIFEQSSTEIWNAVCECCQTCLSDIVDDVGSINAIAFSATCSLVVQYERSNITDDIIMWMDHRSISEAESITKSGNHVLNQFGGVCSPEFSLAKLVWLLNNESNRLKNATGLFELPDWLVYRCMDIKPESCPRSLCCLTCKWGYNAEQGHHCDIVESMSERTRSIIGRTVFKPGMIAGYLSKQAAFELGICKQEHEFDMAGSNIAVGVSLIDAHSGMLAMLSIPWNKFDLDMTIEETFCSLAGTSTCHMLLSKTSNFTRGIWGPYKDVVLDGFYLLEAGQSLTGKLIELCIETNTEGQHELSSGKSIKATIKNLNDQIETTTSETDLHVLPSYHGNRSPLANPRLKGGIYGLTANSSVNLHDQYIATIESIIYETKYIIETLGVKISSILVSGGLMKNKFYMQTLADVLQCKAIKMGLKNVDFMVMGSGLVARCAALNKIRERPEALTEENLGTIDYEQLDIDVFIPNETKISYHKKKYACYREFVDYSLRVDEILNG